MSKYELNIKDGWFTEEFFRGTYAQSFKVKEVLHEETSPFQHIAVLDTEAVGRLLLLDGKTMVSHRDEFVYHECIAHVPAMVARDAKKVLIIGGGDGGVVREFAKHQNLEQIDLVEIDERVVEVSKEYFPECTSALDDPRVNVHAVDGLKFIQERKNTYDIVVVDSTDPEDFAEGLFKYEFYQMVYDALTENGIMTAQTENPFLDEYGIKGIYDELRRAFPIVNSYWGNILIYPGAFWTFAFASKKYSGMELNEKKLLEMEKIQENLKWYNLDWHRGAAFNIPTIQRKTTGV